MSHKSIVIYNV